MSSFNIALVILGPCVTEETRLEGSPSSVLALLTIKKFRWETNTHSGNEVQVYV